MALLPWAGQLLGDLQKAPPSSILGVVYLGNIPTAIAFTTWACVLGRTSAGRTAATTYVVPAVAILLSWVIIGKTPTLVTLAGGTLCLTGVALTRMTRRTRTSRNG